MRTSVGGIGMPTDPGRLRARPGIMVKAVPASVIE